MITLASIAEQSPHDDWLNAPVYVETDGATSTSNRMYPAAAVKFITAKDGKRCIVVARDFMDVIEPRPKAVEKPKRKART